MLLQEIILAHCKLKHTPAKFTRITINVIIPVHGDIKQRKR